MALVDGDLGTIIYKAQKMVDDAFEEHKKHVTEIVIQNRYLIEDSARLYEENAKLRELVLDMASELRYLNDGGISTDCMEYERRMRELGVNE